MRDGISFTTIAKEEIARKDFSDVRLKSLLAAFLKINGQLRIENEGNKIVLKTENAKIAKFIFVSLQRFFKTNPRFAYSKGMRFNKSVTYNIIIDDKVEEIISELEMLNLDGPALSFVKSDDSISGFLAGAFLATGSVNNPESSDYHLEITTSDEELADYIHKLLGKIKALSFKSRVIKRRSQYVIYMKKSSQIVDLLAFIGAEETCLEFESIRVDRDFNNNDNRIQICLNANYSRMVDSSKKQKNDIEIIDRKIGIANLPNKKMRFLCELRLENEDASMVELAESLAEKLEKNVSKSSVNHTFRAIHELAVRLEGNKDGKNHN